MSESELVVAKEFLKCRNCGAETWYMQGLCNQAKNEGRLEEGQKTGASVAQIEVRDRNKQLKVGDVWDVAIIVKDICMECGNEQVIRLEQTKGRAVMRSGLAMPNMQIPNLPPFPPSGLIKN